MSDTVKEVQLSTAFGPSLAEAWLIGHQLDESEEELGHQRSFVLRMEDLGRMPRIVETLPHPVYESWRSDNGTAYCTSNQGRLWVWEKGAWSRQVVAEEEVQLGGIWGFSGTSPKDDALFVTTDTAIYVRVEGTWRMHPMTDLVEVVYRLHGLSPDEVYITTDYGLWRWNGSEIEQADGPEGDLSGVLVLSEGEMIVTDDFLHRWTLQEGWQEIDSPGEDDHTVAVTMFQGCAHVGTLRGVVRLDGAHTELLNETPCNLLASVGDGLIAGRDHTLLLYEGKWQTLPMPRLARGQVI